MLRGLAALRHIETRRRDALPPPESEAAAVEDMRTIGRIIYELEFVEHAVGGSHRDRDLRDDRLSFAFLKSDVQFLRSIASSRGPQSGLGTDEVEHKAALEELTHVVAMYEACEFVPDADDPFAAEG